MRARLQTGVPPISERLARSTPLLNRDKDAECVLVAIQNVLAAIEHSANGRDPG